MQGSTPLGIDTTLPTVGKFRRFAPLSEYSGSSFSDGNEKPATAGAGRVKGEPLHERGALIDPRLRKGAIGALCRAAEASGFGPRTY